MTRSARVVLSFSKLAAQELKHVDFNENEIWRLRWVTVLTLLRAVGHVFKKNDQISCGATVKEKMDQYWMTRKGDTIFKDFIDSTRNVLLKEFDFTHVTPKSFCLLTENGEMIVTESGVPIVTEESIFFKDDYSKTVYQLIDEAIDWWKATLEEMDKLIESDSIGR